MTRLLEPAYEDGVSEPRGGRFDSRLPNARVVSTTVNEYKNASARNFTIMVMQIGQFLDHDVALAPMEEISEIKNLGSKDSLLQLDDFFITISGRFIFLPDVSSK